MRLAWSGLIFHVVVYMWNYEAGEHTSKTSSLCTHGEHFLPSRVVLISLPGLKENHSGILGNLPGVLTQVQLPPSVLPQYAISTGVDRPTLFPYVLDDIFSHANTTVSSEAITARTSPDWIMLAPKEKGKEGASKFDKNTFDHVKKMFAETSMDPLLKRKLNAPSVIFYIRLVSYGKTRSIDTLRSTVKGIDDLIRNVNMFYKDTNTTFIVWGERSGPLWLRGNRIKSNDSTLSISEVTALISTLLRREPPAGTRAIVPLHYLADPKDKAYGLYCNAKQLAGLVLEVQGTSKMISFWRNVNTTKLEESLNQTLKLIKQKKYKVAEKIALKLSQFCFSKFKHFTNVLEELRLCLQLIANVAYILLLSTELLVDENDERELPKKLVCLNLVFSVISCILVAVPFVTPWPQTYHLYLQVLHFLWWGVIGRYYIWSKKIKKINYSEVFSGIALFGALWIVAELCLIDPDIGTSVFVCALAMLPMFPKFTKAPLVLTTSWFMLNAVILFTLNFQFSHRPDTRAINFCSTVWLCLAGFSAFWISPMKDRLICVLMTLLISFAMLVQNMAITYEGDKSFLKYTSWPVLLTPFISFLGRNRLLNRVLHSIIAVAVLLILTSGHLQPFSFLAIMLIVWLWSIMEHYKLKDTIDDESIRRSVYLAFILFLTQHLTKTNETSFVQFDSERAIAFLTIYRDVAIFSCIIAVFSSIMNCDHACYVSVIILLLIIAVSSLKSFLLPAYFDAETNAEIHIRGIVMVSSYYFALLLRSRKKKKADNPIDPHLGIPGH